MNQVGITMGAHQLVDKRGAVALEAVPVHNEDLVSYGVRTHSKSLPSMNTPRCVQQRAVKLRRSIT